MDNIYCIGIDLAKNIFHINAVDNLGKQLLQKKLNRKKLIEFISTLKPCIIAMEACSGANYFANKFKSYGHNCKVIAAQFVKPYVKSNKNDAIDAAAICKAAMDPDMRFAHVKEAWQQDIANIHRSRSLFIKQRISLSNMIRGLLAEYGIVAGLGINVLCRELGKFLNDTDDKRLSAACKIHMQDLFEQLVSYSDFINKFDVSLKEIHDNNEHCQRLAEIPGIGIITATALVAELGNASNFKNGRQLSSYIGLVPRQYSSGGKQRLLGISKRGNSYLRYLLVHGARSLLCSVKIKEKAKSNRLCSLAENKKLYNWVNNLRSKKHDNVCTIALANKLGRICWVVLNKHEHYSCK